MWFDPGVGHVLPGEVLEYHRAANVLSVQAVIAGKVRDSPERNRLITVHRLTAHN